MKAKVSDSRHPCVAVLLGSTLALLAFEHRCSASDHGVATSSVPAKAVPPGLIANPRPVAVYDFAFEVVNQDTEEGLLPHGEGPARRIKRKLRAEETPAQKAARISGLLSETIASELAGMKIPATRNSKDLPWPTNGFALTGQFVQMDGGARIRRAVIGFGAGATEVLAQVEVFDLAQSRDTPALVYGTGSGSKHAPGSIITRNPWAMAARYILTGNPTEKDVRALGRQIAKDLAQLETGNSPKP